MEYFIMELDHNYRAPTSLEWYGILKDTLPKDTLPKHMVFHVEEHMQLVFTDIITAPRIMVSGTLRDIILLYDPFASFTRLLLFSKERKKSAAYYIPDISKVECLMEDSILTPDKSKILKAKIDTQKIGERAIVMIGGVSRGYLLVRLDLAESILRRDTVGIGFVQTQCI